MSETVAALTNGAKADTAPIKKEKEEDVINHPPPSSGGGGGGEDHCDESEDKSLLSHVVPPSHILADGRFIQLPPPLALERSAFFERAVAVHGLISGDGDSNKKKEKSTTTTTKTKPTTKRKKNGSSDDETTTTTSPSPPEDGTEKKKKKKSTSDAPPFVHPLAIASARLHAKGIDEMSKAINLGGLVVGGEYFSLTNIVNQKLTTTATTTTSSSSTSQDATAADASTAGGVDHNGNNKGMIKSNDANKEGGGSVAVLDESILLDSRLRSKYVLQRKQSQYTNASTVLSRHGRRLSSSISVMRILDNRLRTLRQRWRLVAPEHGTRTVGPVRPREVVAVDVEIYDRDRLGGGRSSSRTSCASSNGSSSLGRIARRVPRFATMELEDDYDVSVDVYRLRDEMKRGLEGLKKKKSEESEEENGVNNVNSNSAASANNNNMEVVDGDKNKESPIDNNVPPCKTKAEPFAIADPTLGKIDPDFDPDKVPLLTLLFEIEKPSTGFVERATLSSSFLSSSAAAAASAATNSGGADDKERHNMMHPDERVIEALQHSLFCASLFESMRAEIIPASSSQSNTGGGGSASSSASQQRQKSVAWLSSEMEESFLPPPSVMAGEDTSRVGDTRLISVIHCHEGEVKVQLDDEYSLTVKLIEAGTASAAATNNASSNVVEATTTTTTTKQSNGNDGSSSDRGDDDGGSSGSQSPIQLRTLCRALLLHSQSLYHDHCVKTRMDSTKAKEEEEKPHVGFARTKKEVKTPSPHILQSCVGLGCKFIFEKKVRMALKRLSHWLAATTTNCNDKISIEWLPLALFDSYSRFVLMFRDVSFDVGINGDVLRVSQTSSDHGEFRAVSFGSESELEYFLKLEIKRSLLAND